jgi:filamentous hemagglutinin
VAGKKADVIIANPNGISCNGCGFINTDRVTLSTGKPQLNANGELTGMSVQQGEIQIGEQGLDARHQQQLDILARAVHVHGKVQAQNLKVTTGANTVDRKTGKATPIAGSGVTPTVAVDVSALGGMYADQIELVATDAGAGVNMDGELLSAGHLSLDANGELNLNGKTQGNQSVTVKAPVLTTRGAVVSKGAVTLKGHQQASIQGDVTGKSIAIHSGQGDIQLRGKVQAQEGSVQVIAKGSIQALKALIDSRFDDIQLEAEHLELFDGSEVTAGRHVQIKANTLQVQNSQVKAQQQLGIEAKQVKLSDNAQLHSNNVQIKTERYQQHNSHVLSQSLLNLNSTFNNDWLRTWLLCC